MERIFNDPILPESLNNTPSQGFVSSAYTDADIRRLIGIHKAALQEWRTQGVW
jgi:hypothetical protein